MQAHKTYQELFKKKHQELSTLLEEMEENRKDAPCCGAGGGIRSVYRDLSMEMASNLLSMAKAETVVSTCPFCTFNLNYTSRKKELGKSVTYFTNLVLESLG